MFKMKGVIPPMITPFKETGEMDEYNLQKLVEYLSPKVDGLFICGSYGCGPLMSLEERKRVAEIVKQYVVKDCVVIVHSGTTNTEDTIELTKHARDIGCDAASAVGPYYYKYTDIDLIRHYSAIIKAVKEFPFYVYHNPGFQGYETSMNTMRALKELGLNGIKDATFDILKHATYFPRAGRRQFRRRTGHGSDVDDPPTRSAAAPIFRVSVMFSPSFAGKCTVNPWTARRKKPSNHSLSSISFAT